MFTNASLPLQLRLPLPLPLLLALAGGAVLLLLFAYVRPRRAGFRAEDYRSKSLLTRWEAAALREIRADLPLGYYACPQVRLADFVDVAVRDPAGRRSALNRVALKSVDFAVIDPTGRVALVIELDDRSHDRPDRQLRDQLVNAVLGRCGIAVLRVRPGKRVDVRAHLPDRGWSAAE